MWPSCFFQIVVLGQDLYMFLTLQDGSLHFTTSFGYDAQQLRELLVIPPAWSLGIEFSFYLVAPFIVRRSAGVVAAVLFASLALRLSLQFIGGLHNDPWSYRFFPSELALFLVGSLAYRVYRSLPDACNHRRLLLIFVTACICTAGALLINRWHGISRTASIALLLTLLLTIPLLFRISKSIAWDRALGELSYPIYICHFLVMWMFDYLVVIPGGPLRGLAIVATTIPVAWALYYLVDRRVDAWRHKRLGPSKISFLDEERSPTSLRLAGVTD
jgi:peptidoglycan/LPS O-acetylase OafA/YrhL